MLPSVAPEITIVTWALVGIGMGFAYSGFTLTILRDSPPTHQGAASSALQLSDILGTALGAGVGGAMTAAGERGGGDGLGVALGAVFALTVLVALTGLAATRRIAGRPRVRSTQAAAVD